VEISFYFNLLLLRSIFAHDKMNKSPHASY